MLRGFFILENVHCDMTYLASLQSQQTPVDVLWAAELKSPGYLVGKIDPLVLEMVRMEVRDIHHELNQGKAWDHESVSQIKSQCFHEKTLVDLESYFVNIAHQFSRLFWDRDSQDEWELLDLCVSYQPQNECSPLQAQRGNLSFVIWLEMFLDEVPPPMGDGSAVKQFSKSVDSMNNEVNHAACMKNIFGYRGFEDTIRIFPSYIDYAAYSLNDVDGHWIRVIGNLGLRGEKKPARWRARC